MINFSLNTCWRLIPTKKSREEVMVFPHHFFFLYAHAGRTKKSPDFRKQGDLK